MGQPWENRELAFLLNYADECLLDGKDFASTVSHALHDFTTRTASYNAILAKIRSLLSSYSHRVKLPKFLSTGTGCFDTLPPDLLMEMQQQRPERLGALQIANSSKDAVGEDAISDAEVGRNAEDANLYKDERKRNAPKSYLESPIPESPKGRPKRTRKRKAFADEASDFEYHSKAPPSKRTAHNRASNARSAPSEAPRSQSPMDNAQAESFSIARSESNEMPSRTPKLKINLPRQKERVAPSSQAQEIPKEWEDKINAQSYLLMYVVERGLTYKHLADPSIVEALKIIHSRAERMTADRALVLIDSADKYQEAHKTMLQTFKAAFVQDDLCTKLLFPPIPSAAEVNRSWCEARGGIKGCFEGELEYLLDGPALKEVDAGYVACTIDHLLRDPSKANAIKWSPKAYLTSPHAAHALTSAIFCRWLFATPDPMCHGQHSELQLGQYKTISLGDGLSQVQRLDKLAFSAFFDDANFQETTLQACAKNLCKVFDRAKQMYPAASGSKYIRGVHGWAESALKFKQRIMISPCDYRVHFCSLGQSFDPAWMVAEDDEGLLIPPAQAMSMVVRICLWPALLQLDPEEFDELMPVEAALIKNKRFLPSWEDDLVLDVKTVVSKAVVLVAPGETRVVDA